MSTSAENHHLNASIDINFDTCLDELKEIIADLKTPSIENTREFNVNQTIRSFFRFRKSVGLIAPGDFNKEEKIQFVLKIIRFQIIRHLKPETRIVWEKFIQHQENNGFDNYKMCDPVGPDKNPHYFNADGLDDEFEQTDGLDESQQTDGLDESQQTDGIDDESQQTDGLDEESQQTGGLDESQQTDGLDELQETDGLDELQEIDGIIQINLQYQRAVDHEIIANQPLDSFLYTATEA